MLYQRKREKTSDHCPKEFICSLALCLRPSIPHFLCYTSRLLFILNMSAGVCMCAPLGNQISAVILHSGINIKSLLFTDVCSKSCHSVFPSDFTPIHYSFLPLFTQQNFRENCLSYKNIRAFQEV